MNFKNALNAALLLSIAAGFAARAQSLRDTTLQADYVILTASTNQLQAERLAQFRRSHNGFAVKVVSVESVGVHFPFPNSADSSLRSFITYAMKSWSVPHPQFFVLAGNVNTIPSHKEPGLQISQMILEDSVLIDNWFVETENASPELFRSNAAIGRLPAWTAGQLDTMISKTIAYEQAASGPWTRRSLTLADYNDTDRDIFEREAADLLGALNSVWPDTTMVHIRTSSPNYLDLNGFLSEWNKGAAIISLAGHANPWVFSTSRYLTSSDLQTFDNGTKLPICFFIACTQAYHHEDSASIVERLLSHSEGGAVATIGPTGLSFLNDASSFFHQLIGYFSKDSSLTLGEAVRRTHNVFGNGSLTRRLTILGDPAIVPKRPAETAVITDVPLPAPELSLAQNYPNPFNSTTRFVFSVPRRGRAVMEVFNVLGACVASILDREYERGSYTIDFSGSGLSSGVYLVRLRFGERVKSCKIILLK